MRDFVSLTVGMAFSVQPTKGSCHLFQPTDACSFRSSNKLTVVDKPHLSRTGCSAQVPDETHHGQACPELRLGTLAATSVFAVGFERNSDCEGAFYGRGPRCAEGWLECAAWPGWRDSRLRLLMGLLLVRLKERVDSCIALEERLAFWIRMRRSLGFCDIDKVRRTALIKPDGDAQNVPKIGVHTFKPATTSQPAACFRIFRVVNAMPHPFTSSEAAHSHPSSLQNPQIQPSTSGSSSPQHRRTSYQSP